MDLEAHLGLIQDTRFTMFPLDHTYEGNLVNHENWAYNTNPYVGARPLINCIGNKCKKNHLNIYYQYGEKTHKADHLPFVAMSVALIIIVVIVIVFFYRRSKANKRKEEALLSRIGELGEFEHVEV